MNSEFVPALRWNSLTRFYDVVVSLTARESYFKRRLVAGLALEAGARVLDLGCGTGTLALAIKARQPRATIVGVDADEAVLQRAGRKAGDVGLAVEFRREDARILPFDRSSFDLVVSSLFFHHLLLEDKKRTLAEVLRVLKPGGSLHVADWGRPANLAAHAGFFLVRLFDGFAITRESADGTFPRLLQTAGFAEIRETHAVAAPLGTIRIWRADKGSHAGLQPSPNFGAKRNSP